MIESFGRPTLSLRVVALAYHNLRRALLDMNIFCYLARRAVTVTSEQ